MQALVDTAAADPAQQDKIRPVLLADDGIGPPPGDWPEPSDDARLRARHIAAEAAVAATRAIKSMRIRNLYTALGALPNVQPEFTAIDTTKEIPPAPLLHSCVDNRAAYRLLILAMYHFSPLTREEFDEDIRRSLMRRLNTFAVLEINLWALARDAGFEEPPPYAVRYDLARWLWRPDIAAHILCLRCGCEIQYRRVERAGHPRIGRCRACSRGTETTWPKHALEPYERGTWLLRCEHRDCQEPFVGRRNAHHCQLHRTSTITPAKRKNRRPTR